MSREMLHFISNLFLNNWDIIREKEFHEKHLLTKARNFKNSKITLNNMILFSSFQFPLPFSVSTPSFENSRTVNRKGLENKAPQIKVYMNKT